MKKFVKVSLLLIAVVVVVGVVLWFAVINRMPARVVMASIAAVANLIEPAPNVPPQTLTTRVKVIKAEGLPKELAGRTVNLAFQAPDRVVLSTDIDKQSFTVARNGQELWIEAPKKKFAVVGKPGIARFAAAPDKKDTTQLPAIKLPADLKELFAAVLLLKLDALAPESVGGALCHVYKATPRPTAKEKLHLPDGELRLWIRQSDNLPVRLGYADGKGKDVVVEFEDLQLNAAWPAEKWQLPASADKTVETVALGHLMRFFPAALSVLQQDLPVLGPAKGERRVVATEGKGRLELVDDTQVLFLKGSPEEMGRQHGVLARAGVHDLVDRVLYGVGIGSSFDKGRWFFGEIERATARLAPFIDPRYLAEMDAMAAAAGLEREEIRLANFFPELFHCSGFAVFGDATVGGRIYHGRILDYMRGVGLERNAMVIVHQPDYGNAWVNISYAGFIGSVTAMNDKQISLGEMGGRGEGNWDGKPMAQLVREIMEKAGTLDEAVEIMRKGPRTCEYYYVIADGKSKTAVGIAATPDKFEVIAPGQFHERLPHPQKDTVMMSAGDRYEKLAERVKTGYGKFDDDGARHLMDRPVAMNSNIHSVLFAPDTLDFWVANADAKNVASHTRYTHYNLREMLQAKP
jgi:isopenicillin-N N-acyltransferase-like protein